MVEHAAHAASEPMSGSQVWAALQRSLGDRIDEVCFIARAPLSRPTHDSYRRYLCDLYGFVIGFERRFADTPSIELTFIEQRMRSGRIADDLIALGLIGLERERLAQKCRVPPFQRPLEALAWLFVIERVTAHARSLRPLLERELPRTLSQARAFVTTAEDLAGEQRDELTGLITRWVQDDGDLARFVSVAGEALDCLESWMMSVPRAV